MQAEILDPRKPIFWWLFGLVTVVSLAPVGLGVLLVVNCKVGGCATEGLSLFVFRLLMTLSTWFVFDVSPRLAAVFQLLAPVSAVALGALAGASAVLDENSGRGSGTTLRTAFALCFVVAAVGALVNLGFYSPSEGAPSSSTEIARLVGEKRLVDFIVDSNTKALQTAISNVLILLGIVRVKSLQGNTDKG